MVDMHKHCPICGNPMPLSEKVCSPECEKVYNNKIAQVKKTRIALYGIIAVFLVIWALMTFGIVKL